MSRVLAAGPTLRGGGVWVEGKKKGTERGEIGDV